MGLLFKVFSIITSTISAVNTAELAYTSQPGATKKGAALTAALSAAQAIAGSTLPSGSAEALHAAIGSVMDGYVAIANLVGLFHHNQTPG